MKQQGITSRSVSKLQNVALKQAATNLSGAVKIYRSIFSDRELLNALCKELDLPKIVASQLVSLSRDKETVLSICKQMLASVDGQHVQPVCIYTQYKSVEQECNNSCKSAEWQAENIVVGTMFKEFGFASETLIDGGNPSMRCFQTESTSVIRRYAYCRITRYTPRLVAKCVAYYLGNKPE